MDGFIYFYMIPKVLPDLGDLLALGRLLHESLLFDQRFGPPFLLLRQLLGNVLLQLLLTVLQLFKLFVQLAALIPNLGGQLVDHEADFLTKLIFKKIGNDSKNLVQLLLERVQLLGLLRPLLLQHFPHCRCPFGP
jgi:hypothetical protein